MGKRGPQPVDQDALELWYGAWLGVFEGMRTGRYIRTDLRFDDEKDLWDKLLTAETVEQVREVCDQSPYWRNPKRGATQFHRALYTYTDVFLQAKKDPRWPKSNRPTNEGRRIRFLSRSMAGVMLGISIRTAQDLLAKTDKGKMEAIYFPLCECGHRERDHKDRGHCRDCSCQLYRYSGGKIRKRV